MTIQKRFLVLVDGSERTLQTVKYVRDFMPVDENTRIVLFHVLSGIPEEYRELGKDPACVAAIDQLRTRETEEKGKISIIVVIQVDGRLVIEEKVIEFPEIEQEKIKGFVEEPFYKILADAGEALEWKGGIILQFFEFWIGTPTVSVVFGEVSKEDHFRPVCAIKDETFVYQDCLDKKRDG